MNVPQYTANKRNLKVPVTIPSAILKTKNAPMYVNPKRKEKCICDIMKSPTPRAVRNRSGPGVGTSSPALLAETKHVGVCGRPQEVEQEEGDNFS